MAANPKTAQSLVDKLTLTADQLRTALHVCVVAARGAIILGSPGGGKTSIVRGMARQIGAAFVSSPPLPTLDPTDLRGIPRVESIDGIPRTVWSVPDFLPIAVPDSTSGLGIINYDDFTTAPPAVQAPFYQLWLEGQLGAYQMPPGWVQFATGNYDTDRAGTHRSLTPMRSRWVTLHLGSDVETFARGAVSGWAGVDRLTLPALGARPRPIRPEVLGFIRFRPELLNQFTPDALSYPCERSWEIASDILYAMEAVGGVEPQVEHALLAGTVGMGASAEVLGFLRHFRSLPDMDTILKNPKKAPVPKEPAALYAVSAALARRAEPHGDKCSSGSGGGGGACKGCGTINAVVEYMDRLPTEFQVFALRDAVRRERTLGKTAAFLKWANQNQEFCL
jgi:hypothetical protein